MLRNTRGLCCIVITFGGGLWGQLPSVPPGLQRLDQFEVIERHRLSPRLFSRLTAMGTRLQAQTSARVTYAGTLTDEGGARPVQIVIQNPSSVRVAEGGAANRVVSFDGTRVNSSAGAVSESSARVLLAFAADSPEAIFQQLTAGETYRSLVSQALHSGPAAIGRPAEYVDVYQLLPRSAAKLSIPGAANGKSFAFDSRTGLLRFVSYRNQSGGMSTLHFEDWQTTGAEKYPATIRRLDDGKEIFRVSVQSITLGAALPNGIF